MSERLECAYEMAIHLSALALQCESAFPPNSLRRIHILCALTCINTPLNSFLSRSAEVGDFDDEVHNVAFVSEFRFVPNQNEEFEVDVFEAFKKFK